MAPFAFAGVALAALPAGALWWPARRALIVADLHFEKASWFAKAGQMLPPYDTRATLAAIAALINETDARALWCLGDSFHDSKGMERLATADRATLTTLTAQVDWTWITGNHDAMLADHCGGEIATEAELDGLILRHEADPHETRPELSGHYHPKLRIRARGRYVARRAFIMSDTKIILPAFGALTGGIDADHPAILGIAGTGARAMIPVANRMLSFPLAA
jgi:uncharacterized protein